MAYPTVVILNYFIIILFLALTTVLLFLLLFYLFSFSILASKLSSFWKACHFKINLHKSHMLARWGHLFGRNRYSIVHYPLKVLGEQYTLKCDIFMDLMPAFSKCGAPSNCLRCLSCSYASGHLFAFFQTAESIKETFIHLQTQCLLDSGLHLQHRLTN